MGETKGPVIQFASCSQRDFRSTPENGSAGGLRLNDLSPKGQLFVLVGGGTTNEEFQSAAQLASSIICEAYYADPSSDALLSLRHAFSDASGVFHELVGIDLGDDSGLSCVGLVLLPDRICLARTQNSRVYRISSDQVVSLPYKPQWRAHSGGDERYAGGSESVQLGRLEFSQGTAPRPGQSFVLTSHPLPQTREAGLPQLVTSLSAANASRELIALASQSEHYCNLQIQTIRIQSRSRHFPRWVKAYSSSLHGRAGWSVVTAVLAVALGATAWFALPEKQAAGESPVTIESNLQDRISTARTFLAAGEVEIARNGFRAILSEQPNLVEAHQGLLEISVHYTNRADTLFAAGEFEQALDLYQKALAVQPASEELANRISETEKQISLSVEPAEDLAAAPLPTMKAKPKQVLPLAEVTRATNASMRAPAPQVNLPAHRTTSEPGERSSPAEISSRANMDTVEQQSILVPNSKDWHKLLYRKRLSLFEFSAKAEAAASVRGRYGIIIGYESQQERPYETYYLFSVYRQKQFFLQKSSNFKNELIASAEVDTALAMPTQPIRLSVRSDQDRLRLYANETSIFELMLDRPVDGWIGLYVDPGMQVTFSDVELSRETETGRETHSVVLLPVSRGSDKKALTEARNAR